MSALPALPRESWMVLAAAGVMVALGQTVRLWWRGAALRWRLRSQLVRAAAGEARAEKLLGKAGYRVEGRQVTTRWSVAVDGDVRQVLLRADFVVTRGRRRWVAEVKTGEEAVDVAASATRRQLLEYRCAFDVDGVLLVDAEAGKVRVVAFELPAVSAVGRGAVVTGIMIGVILGVTAAAVAAVWVR
jgi:hypothetical protein